MTVVLDSSVLVAALRSRTGASYRLLRLLRQGRFKLAVSVPLVLEYEAVLIRHSAELGLSSEEAKGLIDYLCKIGHRQEIHFLWRPALSDPADEWVMELAIAGNCEAIVTHNVKHFRAAARFNIAALTPAAFLRKLEEKNE